MLAPGPNQSSFNGYRGGGGGGVKRLTSGWTVRGSISGAGQISCTRPHRPWGPTLFLVVQLKCDGTWRRMGGEVKGKLATGVGSQYPSHYLGTCTQHYYR
jgi:hypothetical protein